MKWKWNRCWKWLSLQFHGRRFDHQPPQWKEGFGTVSVFNRQHVWRSIKQRGCSSVVVVVVVVLHVRNNSFLTQVKEIVPLLDKVLSCSWNTLHKSDPVHWLYWFRISGSGTKCLVGKSVFLWTFDLEKEQNQLIGKVTLVQDPKCCPLLMYLNSPQWYIHSLRETHGFLKGIIILPQHPSRRERTADLGTEWDKLHLYLQDALRLPQGVCERSFEFLDMF